jgi:hypothetical protein
LRPWINTNASKCWRFSLWIGMRVWALAMLFQLQLLVECCHMWPFHDAAYLHPAVHTHLLQGVMMR